ncbi:hypothetical protein CL629_03720 [bacterium]|nr:hypothetical protein [bacterium]|tara:strand:+ start:12492 stop:13733 length:1242 start_codon:yes stop_codon:yes gene_type:complete
MRKIIYPALIIIVIIAIPFGFGFLVGNSFDVEIEDSEQEEKATLVEKILAPIIRKETPAQKPLPNPPKVINGIYLTAWSAANSGTISNVIRLAQDSEINAVIMDIKDFTGVLSYETDIPELKKYNAQENRIKDVNGVIKKLHDAGIYVIARMTVFQDPVLSTARPDLAIHDITKISSSTPISVETLWLDNHDVGWIDPASREAWEYTANIAKDAASRGFDEINFDYIRFPSDAGIENTYFFSWDENTRRETAIKNFFEYIRQELAGTKISADIFGQTTVTYGNDMGIGQVIEDAYEYFDAVAPMIYPSHYVKSFLGFENSAEHPYEVVHYSMEHAKRRLKAMSTTTQARSAIRPWLQDFDLEVPYTEEMVRDQIRATKDAMGDDYAGYLLWDPSNTYTWEALKNDAPQEEIQN